MVHVAKCLALMQAGKTMLREKEGKDPANILSEDATSKHCKTYNAVIIGTSEGLKNVNLPGLVKEIASVMARLDNISEESVRNSCILQLKGLCLTVVKLLKSLIMSEEITNNSGNNLDINK